MTVVKVTQEFIEAGRRSNSQKCPVALAVHALGYEHAAVECDSIYVYNSDRMVELPFEARDFISKFDDGDPVSPFEFAVDL